MSSPIFNDLSLFPNMKQLTNRKNKYTIKYTNTDDIEEAIYQKKQRRYLKNRSNFFYNQSDNKPSNGEVVKIYNIEYYVENFNPLNGKHTLINTRNYSRRYFDLQLYTWDYVKSLSQDKFKMPAPIFPKIKTNLFLKPPLPAINNIEPRKLIYDITKTPLNQFNSPLTITLPTSPAISPIKINRISDTNTFDIESQEFVSDPFKSFDFSFNLDIDKQFDAPIVEKDLIIEDLDLDIIEEHLNDKNIEMDIDDNVEDNKDSVTINSCVNYDYFTTENIKNWEAPKKSSPLIVVHDNKSPLESIIEEPNEDDDDKKEEGGYCTIM